MPRLRGFRRATPAVWRPGRGAGPVLGRADSASRTPATIAARLLPPAGQQVAADAAWFHRPARMDNWTWHELEPHAVSGGRGWYTGAIYAADGSRVASFAQEQLFRTLRPVRPEPSFGTSD